MKWRTRLLAVAAAVLACGPTVDNPSESPAASGSGSEGSVSGTADSGASASSTSEASSSSPDDATTGDTASGWCISTVSFAELTGGATRFADVDGDGRIEVWRIQRDASTETWTLEGFERDSSGVEVLAGGVFAADDVDFADVDGDGRDDLLLIRPNSPDPTTWIQSTPEGFLSVMEQPFGQAPIELARGFQLDDGDGRLDVLATTGTAALAVYRGDGTGSFEPSDTVSLAPDSELSTVAQGPSDPTRIVGFARTPCFGLCDAQDSVVQLTWDHPLLSVQSEAMAPPSSAGRRSEALRDFDGDGRLDLVILEGVELQLWALRGDGSFQVEVLHVPTSDVFVGDFDGDGIATDLLSVHEDALHLLRGSPSGPGPARTVGGVLPVGSADVADLDHDGATELLIRQGRDPGFQLAELVACQ